MAIGGILAENRENKLMVLTAGTASPPVLGTGEEYDMEIGTIELLSDHIHFTLSAPPRIAPMRAAQIL